jgi:hypothetical protein
MEVHEVRERLSNVVHIAAILRYCILTYAAASRG